jgi:hypothetical protein
MKYKLTYRYLFELREGDFIRHRARILPTLPGLVSTAKTLTIHKQIKYL